MGRNNHTSIPHIPRHILHRFKRHPRLLLPQIHNTTTKRRIQFIRIIIALRIRICLNAELEVLEPAAGFHVLVALLVEVWPVAYAAREATHVHEVERGFGVRPFGAGVVDFEADVGGCGGGLSRGEVGSWGRRGVSGNGMEREKEWREVDGTETGTETGWDEIPIISAPGK